MTDALDIPFNYTPREYQRPLFAAWENGIRRACLVWHRRAGKDKTCLCLLIREMLRRPGVYFYAFPTYAQARKAAWENIGKDGFPFMGHIPKQLIHRKLDKEMTIQLKDEYGGSVLRFLGADKVDTIVGTNPVGLVYSEFSLMNPHAWELFRPVLLENDGWAIFNGTPRGRNHFYAMRVMAEMNEDWFFSMRGILDTGVMTQDDVNKEIREGMDPTLAEQEYHCDFSVGAIGTIYADNVEAALKSNRIGDFPIDESLSCDTFWDLGLSDETVIWVRQMRGDQVRFVACLHNRGKPMAFYARQLEEFARVNRVIFGQHWLPHDGGFSTDGGDRLITRQEILTEQLTEFRVSGTVEIAPKVAVDSDKIAAVRARFHYYHFDQLNCQRGIEALTEYRYKFDPNTATTGRKPVHNWASHFADALGTEAAAADIEDPSWSARRNVGRSLKPPTRRGYVESFWQ